MGSTLLLIILTFCTGFAGWLFFLWAVKSGQYDDVEGPKYRMMDDDDDDDEEEEEEEKKKNTEGKKD